MSGPTCPTCKADKVIRAEPEMLIKCDNDCGTYLCEKHGYYYETLGGKFRKGHSSRCGNFELMARYQEKKKKPEYDEEKYKC